VTYDAIVAHAKKDHPDEACGIVAGPEGSDRPERFIGLHFMNPVPLMKLVEIIRGIDADRYIWPHVLDEITKALPAYTWIVDMGGAAPAAPPPGAPQPGAAKADTSADSAVVVPAIQFQVNGRTVDIQAYTRFLRQLEASPWITDVTPVSAQTVVEKERPVTAFTIRATYRQADSAYLRTVPLSQSVR